MQAIELPGVDTSARIQTYQEGGYVSVVVCGMVVFRWREKEYRERDLFIAALGRMDIKGTTIATLAFTSPPTVTRVLKMLRAHGEQALLDRPAPGSTPVMTARHIQQALELRKKGLAIRAVAEALGFKHAVVGEVLRGIPAGATEPQQMPLALTTTEPALTEPTPPAHEVIDASEQVECDRDDEPLRPAEPLSSGDAEHTCRYAGTMLVIAATLTLGLRAAMERAQVRRPRTAKYDATQAVAALLAAWSSGHASIEALHEADARSLGVVLGLERSPSVRTLHRAIVQMRADYDPVQWWVGWMLGVMRAIPAPLPLYGVDGHFKRYAGEEPVDKGYNTKRRLAEKGLQTVRVMDLRGITHCELMVRASDKLSEHLLLAAAALAEAQRVVGACVPIILAFDRGGFCFEVLSTLAAAGHWYLTWVPSTVKLPNLDALVAPDALVGEQLWSHPELDHPARLLVQRDGARCIPAATNLPPWVDTATALESLRKARGMQENGFKAAREHAHIDHLEDRGAHGHRPDDRMVRNPAREHLSSRLNDLRDDELLLRRQLAMASAKDRRSTEDRLEFNELSQSILSSMRRDEPARLERRELEPEAERAELTVRNRQLLMPLKNATENARRWLIAELDAALDPSDNPWDQDTRSRTLEALIQAPGRVVFGADKIVVTLELPLPPLPHRRLADALRGLDNKGLRSHDERCICFRLAPRPTRRNIPGAQA